MSQSSERLLIERFAGIEHLDLDPRPFTVLIGPQSVGKSITAKLLFFFKSIPLVLYAAALDDTDLNTGEIVSQRFDEALPSPTHSGGAARITYSTGDTEIALQHTGKVDSRWEVHLPKALHKAFSELKRGLREEGDDDDIREANEASKEAYQKSVEEMYPGSFDRPRFVPAGRSFFTQIERDFASYFESASLDPFIAEFGKFLAHVKGRMRIREYLPASKPATALAEELLSGRYAREGKEEVIHSVDGRRLPPKLWSSGQQEAQPLALLLQRYCDGFFVPTSLFIEEPEAHLFPSSQRIVTELIALAFNARRPGGMKAFLTTHSPYILTTLNNLLLAGQFHQRRMSAVRKSALAKIVPGDRALVPGQLGAFYMDREGCRSILDPDTGLIGASTIDKVSGDLTEQFDALLEFDRR
jgi:hypothetical protein